MPNESEFYVGYLPIPGGLRKFTRRVVGALGAVAVATAAMVIAAQHPFASSVFEFEQYRDLRGTLLAAPYGALAIPGQGSPWLLVGQGKHGAGDLSPLDGREVQLRGERIFRGEDHMIQLQPGTLRAAGHGDLAVAIVDLGEVQLTGEVVDSKCYFGVMNPGNGKVHRDCAVRCISGGVPPAFLVRDGEGRASTMLLANWKRELLDHIAEPMTLRGRLSRSSGRVTLHLE